MYPACWTKYNIVKYKILRQIDINVCDETLFSRGFCANVARNNTFIAVLKFALNVTLEMSYLG